MTAAQRALRTAKRIAQKPTSIAIDRDGVDLAAQTVRLETFSGERNVVGESGTTHQIDALIVGYKDHPTITATDILPGDRFVAHGVAYEVIALAIETPGSVQAYLQVRR